MHASVGATRVIFGRRQARSSFLESLSCAWSCTDRFEAVDGWLCVYMICINELSISSAGAAHFHKQKGSQCFRDERRRRVSIQERRRVLRGEMTRGAATSCRELSERLSLCFATQVRPFLRRFTASVSASGKQRGAAGLR